MKVSLCEVRWWGKVLNIDFKLLCYRQFSRNLLCHRWFFRNYLEKKKVFRKALKTWFYKNHAWKRLSRHWLITNSIVECSQINDGVTRKLESAMLLPLLKSRISENEYAEPDDNNRSTAGINELAVAKDCQGL